MIQMCHGNSLPSVWEVPTHPAQFRSVWVKGKEMTATHSQPGLRPESQTGVGERTDNWGTDLTPFLESGAKPCSTDVCARTFHCLCQNFSLSVPELFIVSLTMWQKSETMNHLLTH